MARITHSTEYVRHNFSKDELISFAQELAAAHAEEEQINAEEDVIKTQFKNRRAQQVQRMGMLYGHIQLGFDMRNVRCRLDWDVPNIGEITYVREDSGEAIKVRPMTEQERQQELDWKEQEPAAPVELTDAAAEAVTAASEVNAADFFKGPESASDEQEPAAQPAAVEEAVPGEEANDGLYHPEVEDEDAERVETSD
jgi:hypothetical protein